MKNQHIKFDDALKKQKGLLTKKNNKVKIDANTPKLKDIVSNVKNFCNFREKVLNFFRDYTEMVFDASYKEKHRCFKDYRKLLHK